MRLSGYIGREEVGRAHTLSGMSGECSASPTSSSRRTDTMEVA